QHAAPQLCCGGAAVQAKRSCLTAENFENLIFMKGNMDIIQQHIMSLKIQEEEE
ncbi:Uncharacterized protein FKW44_006770, partial [Caligus rogercresseyi]